MAFYRRRLPHWQPGSASIFITWRLAKSLPVSFRIRNAQEEPRKAFVRFDRVLDTAVHGPKWLEDSRIARAVVQSLHRGKELGHYELFAYVVMPNHVHVLLGPRVEIARITKGIKGVTAREANKILGRIGEPFWLTESFDHWIRTDFSFRRVIRYIEMNPVTAGLVGEPEDWPWSSAAVGGKSFAAAAGTQ